MDLDVDMVDLVLGTIPMAPKRMREEVGRWSRMCAFS